MLIFMFNADVNSTWQNLTNKLRFYFLFLTSKHRNVSLHCRIGRKNMSDSVYLKTVSHQGGEW